MISENAPQWEISDEQFEKLNLADLQFVFSQSEKLLTENLKSIDLLITRTNAIIALTMGLISLFMGVCFVQWKDTHLINDVILVLGSCSLYLIAILVRVILNSKPLKIYYTGSRPKDMLAQSLYDPYYDKDNARLKELVWCEIKSYQDRIEKVSQSVSIATNELNLTVTLLYLFPIVIVAAALIAFLIP